MSKSKAWLRVWGERAGWLLGLYGLFSLVWVGVWKIHELMTFNTDALVRPICEEIDLSTWISDEASDETGKRAFLIGVILDAERAINNLQLRLHDLRRVYEWGSVSNGATLEDIKQFKAHLPTGRVYRTIVLPAFPTLAANSRTTVYAIAEPREGFHCTDDWFDASGPGLSVTLLQFPPVWPFRGKSWLFMEPRYVFWGLLSITVIAGIVARTWLVRSRGSSQ